MEDLGINDIQRKIDEELRKQPGFEGLRDDKPFNFRIMRQHEADQLLYEKKDPQLFLIDKTEQ
jgi:hypothetical protein